MSIRVHRTVLPLALLVQGACVAEVSEPADDDSTGGQLGQLESLSNTTTFKPTDDAFVESAHASTNYGSDLTIGGWVGSDSRLSYLKFNVATSAPIASAKLRCHVTSNGASKNGPQIFVAGSSWSQKTVTYKTRPATSGSAIANLGAAAAGTWVEWDVSKAVPAAGGIVSLGMISDSDDGMYCDSSEAGANGPQLVVTTTATTAPPPTPPPTTPPPTTPPPTTPPPTTALSCPTGFSTEVFRDDFNGTALDTSRWNVANQSTGSDTFTGITSMLSSRVSVSNGTLKIAAQRHCRDPYANAGEPEHTGLCSGANYYSGGWITGKMPRAAGKGLMIFRAQMPSMVQGIWPGLWARNTRGWGTSTYGELDLIEQWWDNEKKGVQSSPNEFSVTTWVYNGSASVHSNGGVAGPIAGLSSGFHVWEVEWDATVTPAIVHYYYRDQPGSTRTLLYAMTYQTAFSGAMTDATFKNMINDAGCSGTNCGWRPYIDLSVAPDDTWHIGPDVASTFDPTDLEVDSVITCQP